ncbi:MULTISPECIES: 3D-(3,5/4)-trihydroxycyclohexane-1,2-dione acylhydrolase (decyclizing) [unclassified Mesorhizobium]|uniref:3D-(3,5/4)-trihydroxycyclohexane-1,2-dione acylhydrolase (decyclizing) n=1 Tax=unclassified Mesorhizobium TaxID=325217 RepID=UPI00112647EB|nr:MULTISPECIES: 3D-(3,5/4)-trihydroxycyclohexane-1,2-dione acylhydrolase (decyclizing) [unclassified Mesorhizobium]MBZ9703812.1 3D-(3,5/4)-trihydroxycyclohexane-1,2-dione acylhydrolase (decyclizing) [Mesorhizobium sp. CO1-1-3]MBZ9918434.1 3D-(3,5/4)-trihydroxycyclohexane-1,2-dione acylhydrolase (decyclizing) [Mesorhizobium sp. BR1-1-7]MBZ9947465.1 3D-(3,5/4)-trihydroxycyclohexane-1,2-dione acylhydrolase (decyclizing) [Mesorhizobium sp. BR1-1-11]MBZ9953499.1 3D-(3,5/4)-trihydroxycyclohexane-1,2
MSKTIRLTMAQALTRFLSKQKTEIDGAKVPIFGGVWAIFGHGNVAGIGEALYQVRDELPTFRAHNEQAMAHAAIAYGKANFRRRFMAATSSIGPGALNMVTAAALAHVNRLPVLFLPGDVFANRIPDPVLQQAEDFSDGTATVNDCFRPVSRYFDRITRPEQIIPALNRAMAVLTDPAECGPVTLSLCQDVQAEAYDYPESFFAERVWCQRRPRPDRAELAAAVAALKSASKPLVIAGGGVLYSRASDELAKFVEGAGIPVCETQGGKSSLPDDHPLNMAAIGVTGTSAANRLAEEADVVLAIGTRLQDFTTGSWALFKNSGKTIIGLNVQPFDAGKHRASPLVADAAEGLAELGAALKGWKAPSAWTDNAAAGKKEWQAEAAKVTASTNAAYPSDAQVIGAVQRAMGSGVTLLNAAGGLPGELHKLWQAGAPGSYHAEYGFSTMGYEIAGGLGTKMAKPEEEVVVMIGDGSYLMLNSEIATSVMLGLKLTIVLLDNRGFGCINRLQMATGGANFNNLLKDARHEVLPDVNFAAHAASMGAIAEKVSSIAGLETALAQAKGNDRTTVLVIDTDPLVSTDAGGHWWDVAVPEVSERSQVNAARKVYDEKRRMQSVGD